MNNYIDLSIRELYFNCCDDKEVFLNNMLFIRDNYNRKIHNLTSYTPYSIYHFMHTLRGGYNGDNFEIKLNGDDLLSGICNMFEIDSNGLSEEETINLINENIQKLKSIKNKSLKDVYPKFYDMFQQGLGLYHKWSPIEFLDPSNPNDIDLYKRLKKEKNEYFSYGFRYSYDKFTDVQADYYERLLRHRNDIKEYCEEKTYVNDIYFNGLNNDKFNLYIFKKYLDKIENCQNDKTRIELLNLLKNKIYNIIDINDDICIFNDINKTSLIARYTVLNRKYNIPKRVEVDGAILPSSEDYSKKGTGVSRTFKPLSDEERQELISINRRKKEFYNNSGYLTVITEKVDLTGNAAFVYPNGHILEDYIADEESDASLKKNKKNAVYHVDIYGFLDLLDMGKLEVKRDSRCHGTYNHVGDWVTKLQKVVDIETTSEVFDDTKKFIKKLEEKKIRH